MYQRLAFLGFVLVYCVAPQFAAGQAPGKRYAKLSPFSAIRWNDDSPEVQVNLTWCELLKIDDLNVDQIRSYCEKTYSSQARLRFGEDLVEVLTRMGHEPNDTSALTVKDLSNAETKVLRDIAWTSSNRESVRQSRLEILENTVRDARGDPKISPSDPKFAEAVEQFMLAAQTKAGFSGAVIIAKANKVLYAKAFGYADVQSQVPNTLDTPFRIASLSKQFTAAAILRLQQEGRLRVTDPVAKYLPQFKKEPYDKIQIHHLLSHTSGLPRTPSGVVTRYKWNALSKRPAKVQEYVDLAVATPLESPIGKRYQYSNFGFRVLSAVIESIDGGSFANHMDTAIFHPSKMSHSGVAQVPASKLEREVARGLRLRKLGANGDPSTYSDGQRGRIYASGFGSGGIYSSANDLLRWHRVLNTTDLLNVESKRQLFHPNLGGYAYGWVVKKSNGKATQHHSGANEGFFSIMTRVPADDLVIIAVGNVDSFDTLDTTVDELVRLARGLQYKLP